MGNIYYLDNNATTPIDQKVLDTMLPYLRESYANPSSTHSFGLQIKEKVDKARQNIADFINSESNEIIFTSGSTEAVNIALKGVAMNYASKGKHIVTISTEHKAVLDTCKDLENKGFEVTYLPVQSNGLVDLDAMQKTIRKDTILVSVMYVNNETGIIQPIKKIAALAHDKGALFFTDATQAAGKIKIDVEELAVDLLCFSGHKMYAPKGIGALYVNKRGNKIKLAPHTHGGGHEQGLRSGTLNVPGIMALSHACEIADREMDHDRIKIKALRDQLESKLLVLPNTSLNGAPNHRIYNTSNICFKGQDANMLIARMPDIAVSNGSACTSAVMEPSHVLKAMGLDDDDGFASLRFSLGKFNSEDDIIAVIERIKKLTQSI